jgi:hypothetical protein
MRKKLFKFFINIIIFPRNWEYKHLVGLRNDGSDVIMTYDK